MAACIQYLKKKKKKKKSLSIGLDKRHILIIVLFLHENTLSFNLSIWIDKKQCRPRSDAAENSI